MAEGPRDEGSVTAQRIVDALGLDLSAALLGVDTGRVGAWAAGAESPSAEEQNRVADLDLLADHLLGAFTPAQARLWLVGENSHLGARPADVFRAEGSAQVIGAIRAYQEGSFA